MPRGPPHCPRCIQEVKLRFYRLLIQLQTHNKDPIALCRSFQAVYRTRNVDKDRAVWQEALQGIVVFLALSAYDNEVSDLLHRFKADPKLGELPAYKCVVGPRSERLLPYQGFVCVGGGVGGRRLVTGSCWVGRAEPGGAGSGGGACTNPVPGRGAASAYVFCAGLSCRPPGAW